MKLLFSVTAMMMAVSAVPIDQPSTVSSTNGIVPGKYFDRIVIVVFENADFLRTTNNAYFGSLAERHNGIELTNFAALTHPSQPNYIGLISGSTEGSVDDDKVTIDRESIVDLLERKNISWKSYQQDYPGGCETKMRIGKYARKHNPFISFKNIQTNPERCAKIVNADVLDEDIKNDTVPQYVFYTPNMDNDGHDTSIVRAAQWFSKFLEPRLKEPSFTRNTLFVSTFDEAKHYTHVPNRVQTVLFGPDFKRPSNATTDDTSYNHYSILRTIEDNWDLDTMNLIDRIAVPFAL